jgi:cytochrome d ubiquinol oxidase subunit I
MDNFIAARSQMGMSLAFHIIFATIGVSLPLMMTISEWRWRSTGDPVYLLLAKRWAKGTTILFAVGAISGTVLSFELGLLWPRFMQYAGAVIGMPFSLEGFAFFTEAIFLGIYLYGWDRVPGWFHLLSGIIVAISGVLSAIFVTLVNGWMNTPTGFDIVAGKFQNIHPLLRCSIQPEFRKRYTWSSQRIRQPALQRPASMDGCSCAAAGIDSMRSRLESRCSSVVQLSSFRA